MPETQTVPQSEKEQIEQHLSLDGVNGLGRNAVRVDIEKAGNVREVEETKVDVFDNDFWIKGPNGGYFYPHHTINRPPLRGEDTAQLALKQEELRDRAHLSDYLLQNRQGDAYVEEGFDIAQTIHDLQGPSAEIGGPSPLGYDALNDVEFPQKPLVTNIAGSRYNGVAFTGGDTLAPIDKSYLDALADSRHLPFKNESMAALFASYLPWDPQEVRVPSEDEALKAYLKQKSEIFTNFISKIPGHSLEELAQTPEAEFSPRIGMLLESARTLKPGGLVILSGPLEGDLKIAQQLGFKMKMHSLIMESGLPREVVLQKPSEAQAS
jgi:hypothetical protein